ncbi:MAG: UDP-N-acetylmuramoyl-tripeptide--D-alanyl-D-alanine ligase [Acidobacteria bacterium]|nr:UDP-N-acetylmuramoyl-tripeptide--D-alanyl-D-alanine ligase [Acidobacteriota bacterium]MBI3662408.1 UDP-N-acetylmuramoyl-tripeptide--D-alanyl-D-alanine ligase [Acidobacteriota bacterium]
MRWTVQQVARALGVAAPPGLDPLARLAGVSIDSRTVGAGELFIAIHGPRHDGHAFVAAAFGHGALAAVVARSRLVDYPEAIRTKLFAVDDALAALQRLAWTVRDDWRAADPGRCLAAVTGSTGKTTTKEILAALLAARFRVLKNEGNLNNEYGVPLTLLRLEDDHDAAVLELGMSHRGEIERLARITEPEVGVVTLVAPVHLEFFASLDEIALAKRELIENLAGPAPVAVLNADDPRVSRFASAFRGKVLTFGLGKDADFRAEKIEDRGAEGIAFDFVWPSVGSVASGPEDSGWRVAGEKDGGTDAEEKNRLEAGGTEARAGKSACATRLELPLAGRHNVMNALAALAAASVWGVGAEEAKRVFPTLAPAAMRGEVLKFQAGFTVINDCYNSNPVALASMIGLLAGTPGYRRRILAAGEMLELGPESGRLHREAGHLAASIGLDWIFGVQGLAEEFVLGAEEAGQSPTRTRFFNTADEAATYLCALIEPGDLLLVKGSRGVRMERIVEALTATHALAPVGPPRRVEILRFAQDDNAKDDKERRD